MKLKHISLLFVVVIVLLACANNNKLAGPQNTATPTGEPTKTPATTATASNDSITTKDEAKEGDFIYRLSTEKGEYSGNDTIRIFAELEYIGDKQEIAIYHAASPFHFPMVEKTRNIKIEYPMNQPLLKTTLIKGKPLREEYKRSGGYGSEDEKKYLDFMKSFIEKGFPVGQYVVNGFAGFFVESSETGKPQKDYAIKAQIGFKVK